MISFNDIYDVPEKIAVILPDYTITAGTIKFVPVDFKDKKRYSNKKHVIIDNSDFTLSLLPFLEFNRNKKDLTNANDDMIGRSFGSVSTGYYNASVTIYVTSDSIQRLLNGYSFYFQVSLAEFHNLILNSNTVNGVFFSKFRFAGSIGKYIYSTKKLFPISSNFIQLDYSNLIKSIFDLKSIGFNKLVEGHLYANKSSKELYLYLGKINNCIGIDSKLVVDYRFTWLSWANRACYKDNVNLPIDSITIELCDLIATSSSTYFREGLSLIQEMPLFIRLVDIESYEPSARREAFENILNLIKTSKSTVDLFKNVFLKGKDSMLATVSITKNLRLVDLGYYLQHSVKFSDDVKQLCMDLYDNSYLKSIDREDREDILITFCPELLNIIGKEKLVKNLIEKSKFKVENMKYLLDREIKNGTFGNSPICEKFLGLKTNEDIDNFKNILTKLINDNDE